MRFCRNCDFKYLIQMDNTYDIETYIDKLEGELVRICRESGFKVTSAPVEGIVNGSVQTAPSMLLSSPDIDEHWQKLGGDYVADAMPQIADYPTVAVAWASYLGMAVAYGWDSDWSMCSNMPYSVYYGSQGFDDMDDHIISDIIGVDLNSPEAESLRNLFRRCADATISLIRHENIEPQSIVAYQVFVASCHEMYRIGAAVELARLGYKFEKL